MSAQLAPLAQRLTSAIQLSVRPGVFAGCWPEILGFCSVGLHRATPNMAAGFSHREGSETERRETSRKTEVLVFL